MLFKSASIVSMIFLSIFCISSCGCPFPIGDGYLGIEGKTYEWVNSPVGATSKIYHNYYRDVKITLEEMIEDIPEEMIIKPLGNVKVEVDSKKSVQSTRNGDYYYRDISDEEGNFEEYWTVYPGEYQILIKVSKPGYMEEIIETNHDTGDLDNHIIVAILVKMEK